MAVLVLGSPSTVAAELLAAVVAEAGADARGGSAAGKCALHPELAVALVDTLPTTPGHGPTGLHFGPVENLAGLERPPVVATGMQHPRHLVHRKEAEGWRDGGSTVDPRACLGVTRCTLEPSVVEVTVANCAAHFKVAAAAAAGAGAAVGGAARAAASVGAALCSNQPSNAVVEPAPPDEAGLRHVRVGVVIDLAAPPARDDLATARVLSFGGTWTWRAMGCRASPVHRQPRRPHDVGPRAEPADEPPRVPWQTRRPHDVGPRAEPADEPPRVPRQPRRPHDVEPGPEPADEPPRVPRQPRRPHDVGPRAETATPASRSWACPRTS